MTPPSDDRILAMAMTEGRRSLRRHLVWQVFAFVGMLALVTTVVYLLLLPSLLLMASPIVSATVEYDAPGGSVFAVIDLDDGRQARGVVAGDPAAATVDVRWDPGRPQLMGSARGPWLQLGFGIGVTGLFAAGAVISARSIQHHRRALRRIEADLARASRQSQRMLLTTQYWRTRSGAWSTLLFTVPGEEGPRLKSRAFGRRYPEMVDHEVTVHGRIAHGGNAVVEFDDGELVVLHEPLLRTLGSHRTS